MTDIEEEQQPLLTAEQVHTFGYDFLDSVGQPTPPLLAVEEECFPDIAVMLRRSVQALAARFTEDARHCMWGFEANEIHTAGFWYPLRIASLNVDVESNGYTNEAMDPRAFGAGVTLIAINHFLWYMDSKRQDSAPGALTSEEMNELNYMYYAVRKFLLDLCEAELLDTESFVPFID